MQGCDAIKMPRLDFILSILVVEGLWVKVQPPFIKQQLNAVRYKILTYLFYLLNYWLILCEQGAKDDGYS